MSRRLAPRAAISLASFLALAVTGGVATAQSPTPPDPAPTAETVTASPTGVLELNSDPPGATVLLGDRLLGVTPLRVEVAPGTYEVTLRKEGVGDQSFPVTIEAGQLVRDTRSLAPEPTGFSPFLTALLVTGVVGLGIVLWRRWHEGKAQAGKAEPIRVPEAPPPTDRPAPTGRADGPGSSAGSAEAAGSTGAPAATASDQRPGPDAAALTALASGPGERFGDYTLREQLGKGGMATVFLAERGEELVALKRPLATFLDDRDFLTRFLREAEIGHTLYHPNIVRTYEQGEVAGVPYFTMEYLKGQTLHQVFRERGALPSPEACRIAFQVAEALDYAHLKGIIHRDLKPSNVMVLPDGALKVMDYGIARAHRFSGLTTTGAFMGTPDYVAPEVAQGTGTDARSDLYSLGVLFYQALAGRKPFTGDTPFDTLRKHVSEPPSPPSRHGPETPPEIEAIVLRLLAKDPNDRYPSAEALLVELRAYLSRAA